MQPVKINLATANDIDLLVELRILFGNELTGKQEPAIEANLRDNLRQYFTEELNQSYICSYAELEGQVVSVAGLVIRRQPASLKNPSGRWGYVMNVFTLPAYRGRGLSAQVIRVLLDHATSLGVPAFELHATPQGESVYQKLGFEIHPEPTYRKFAG
ncbi:GNAT family N-acetyltransferase [Taibaiella chishuiensis]|uniref:RimJ/RimL family protein N-acetyltransferase n=1 Tax=Taibaiella chishuiensis TaxID=1434707 RepID=A0A2P8D210_9BACT|nr:GNAT family N-acetyltransferase [Taibaiella chishuiensis]PSK91241.1 RimJ/RimL family protein N-acetyltransferase [Taibaiella chishuiensis]